MAGQAGTRVANAIHSLWWFPEIPPHQTYLTVLTLFQWLFHTSGILQLMLKTFLKSFKGFQTQNRQWLALMCLMFPAKQSQAWHSWQATSVCSLASPRWLQAQHKWQTIADHLVAPTMCLWTGCSKQLTSACTRVPPISLQNKHTQWPVSDHSWQHPTASQMTDTKGIIDRHSSPTKANRTQWGQLPHNHSAAVVTASQPEG